MVRPREIKEKDLPLVLLGQEEHTFKDVYNLTTLRNRDLDLSLKFNGYINRKAVLQSSDIIDNAWVKQA